MDLININISDGIQDFLDWTISHGLRIVLIIVGAKMIRRFSKGFIEKGIRKAITLTARDSQSEKKREDTLISVLSGIVSVVIFLTAAIMVLGEIGVDIAPLLAGAGVVGLAVGMASRDLVADYISGLFIILEDQYRVGDRIKIGSVEGRVVDITLRRTIVVDDAGVETFIPNGKVEITSRKGERSESNSDHPSS